MEVEQRTVRQLTHEFFHQHPDYSFCQTLAFNIKNNVTTYENAMEILAAKTQTSKENQKEIEEKLAQRVVHVNGRQVQIKDLSLTQILKQENNTLHQIMDGGRSTSQTW